MKTVTREYIKKILITRTDRIGDVLLSTSAFEAIRKTFPRAKVYVLVLPTTSELLEGNPSIDQVIVYDKRGKERSFLNTIKFAYQLRRENIDIAVHLHPTNRVHIISFIAGIPVRIGYAKKCGFLLTHKIPDIKKEGKKHEAAYNFDLLNLVGVEEPETLHPYFQVEEKYIKALDDVLTKNNVLLSSCIVLAPSASCPSKRWPARNFALLADTLIQKYKLPVVLIGDASDKKITQEVIGHMHESAIDLAGLLTLKMVGALFERAKLLVSNDTGPVHIAASLDLPVIALFGRSDRGLSPERWRPLSESSSYVHKSVGCTTCLAHNCERDFACLAAISVEEVVALVAQKYSSHIQQ